MNGTDLITMIESNPDYAFLKTNPNLNNIILLGLSGSHAYGTSNDNSDLDIRGVALNSKSEILLGNDFQQVVDMNTDTTIYSVNKILNLLSQSNPNTMELLGLDDDDYILKSEIGQLILDNQSIFLSKECAYTFGAYAQQQIHRLQKYTVSNQTNNVPIEYVADAMDSAMKLHRIHYGVDIDVKVHDDKIVFDGEMNNIPVKTFNTIMSNMNDIIREYDKLGKRNKNAIVHNKLSKHMMHVIRLCLTCIGILEENKVVTKITRDHALLMDIRNKKYQDDNDMPTKEYFELAEECKNKLKYTLKNTSLPDTPDYRKINDLRMYINELIVTQNK